jgi:hypothetical protein
MYYPHKNLLMISEDAVFKAIAHPEVASISISKYGTRSFRSQLENPRSGAKKQREHCLPPLKPYPVQPVSSRLESRTLILYTGMPLMRVPLQRGRQPTCFGATDTAGVRDPFGHVWALCTVKEVLTPEEVEVRMRSFTAQMKGQKR